MRNSLRGVICVCLYVCLAGLLAVSMTAFVPATAWGQAGSTGTITGVVVDNTNAVVPGATVALVQPATGAVRGTTTSNEGRYVFAYVDPGVYDIKVSKQGFTTTVISNQVVKIGSQLTENVTLQVGAVSTTVTVTENPGAELQTLTPTVGSTLSGAIITNLPNTTRDASTLAALQPGQNINGNTGGVASDQNSFQLDGGFATDDMSGDNNTYIASFSGNTAGGAGAYHSSGFNQMPSAVVPMPVSTIEEFKVSTANQTADFNGGAGSQIQVATKRGTNTFHGTAYDYYLDNNFGGANTWDNNSTGRKQPSSHFSRFGANGGGKIPGLNVLGGGWYIFGGYEGFRFPNSSVFEESFPTPSLRAGLIKLNGEVVNLNPTATTDPGTSNTYAANSATCISSKGCDFDVNGNPIYAQGAVIPCTGTGGCDPRGLGLNPVMCTPNGSGGCTSGLWSLVPLPNDCTHGDGVNYCGYKGTIAQPQKSNFVVARIDHDFAKNEHFDATYHYYKLTNTVANQWDVGGVFPGDTFGKYSAIRQKPQVPWIYTAGLTTDVTSNLTNDVHFSYTRNYWAYIDPSGVPNVANYPAALEVGGETSNPFGPYNTNNQSTRYRYWDGHDWMLRDDVTWVKGNHLFQLGGSWLRNWDAHLRNDNGESINTFEQYLVGAGNSASLGGFGISMSGYIPAGITTTKTYGNLYSMITGMVDETQSLYVRGLGSQLSGLPLLPRTPCALSSVPATNACVASPPLLNQSIIPTYSAYLTDSWHLRPSLSLNYGVGYTVEMPPYEVNGGRQTVMVDQSGNMFYAMQYLKNEQQSALQGLAYAPLIGFEAVRNVPHHAMYPYDPYYGGISPRIGIAWNFRPDTVVRAGFSRIFGRINGVNPILVPMLTPGLMQPATCGGPGAPKIVGNNTTCGGTTPASVFRVGVDCPGSGPCAAPLPAPSANLPEPWYPGFNDVGTGAGETIDPNFHPNRSDEFTLSIQHQFGPKILAEVGYIGRLLGNEIQYYSLSNVPYMMTQGGQTFSDAWKNIMIATNYGTGVNTATNFTNGFGDLDFSTVAQQAFFEAGINSAYLTDTNAAIAKYNTKNAAKTGFVPLTACPNLTCAFLTNEASGPIGTGNMSVSDVYDPWTDVSGSGYFVFGRSIPSDPIPSSGLLGTNGQSPSLLTTVSNGYGNYNGGYLQLTFTDWHGLTMKSNFSYSNALGTGDVVQASSSYATNDPFNIHNSYGPQYYNEKFVFNLFLNYAEPYYASQKGAVGRLLGGWSFAPLFVWGTGFPVELNTAMGDCGTFGECNTNYTGSYENMFFTQNVHYSAGRHQVKGTACGFRGAGFNVFSNPDASCPQNGGIFGDPTRNPVLGLDGQMGGGGPITGLPFWNLDLGITKDVKILERVKTSLYFDFTNVANHMVAADPCFLGYDTRYWGVLGCGGNLQANTPRRLQLGLSLNW